jgi:hypothetical protein
MRLALFAVLTFVSVTLASLVIGAVNSVEPRIPILATISVVIMYLLLTALSAASSRWSNQS